MNRTSLAFAVPFGLTIMAAGAKAEPVMHGAMDICQAVDDGTTTQSNGVEVCCAQEVTEYDSGYIDFGEKYCVACVAGTGDCIRQEVARNTPQQTARDMTKALAAKPKKGACHRRLGYGRATCRRCNAGMKFPRDSIEKLRYFPAPVGRRLTGAYSSWREPRSKFWDDMVLGTASRAVRAERSAEKAGFSGPAFFAEPA